MTQTAKEYDAEYCTGFTGEELHCGNCEQLGMCLGLEFTQPYSCPTDIFKSGCSFFSWCPRCKYCGKRKVMIGKDTWWHWGCKDEKCKELATVDKNRLKLIGEKKVE